MWHAGRSNPGNPLRWGAALQSVAGRQAQLRFAVRMMTAGFLSFLIAGLLGLPQGYWVLFSAVIVMQNNVGSSLKAAADRLVGTIAGALVGFLATLVVTHDLLPEALMLACVLGPLGFLAASHPRFKVAPVRAIIVILSRTGQEPAFWLAVERVMEIILGGVISVAVALLVLPARAHSDLAEHASRLIALLGDVWKLELESLTGAGDASTMGARLQSVNDRIRAAVAAAEASGDDAQRERAALLTESDDPDPLLRTLRRLRHDFILVGRASATPLPAPVLERLGAPLARIGRTLDAELVALAASAKGRTVPPFSDEMIAALDDFASALQRLRGEGLLEQFGPQAAGSLFTLGFAFEELRREVPDLRNRLAEFVLPARPKGGI
ncbi:MAG: FUSC family protein [Parvibaculum sp.]|uniref:FUSC family protein n=1 Tax=Parvibaculum sp. TaxID=2024848 RepID=UPI003C7692EF